MSDRLIYVVGTPSGGTSAVAGVLHHLGVDMGEFPEASGIRGYTTYEDTHTNAFKITPDGTEEIVVRQRLRLRAYIDYRRRHQRKGQRIGTKGSALWWLAEAHVAAIPLDVVRVLRPIEHSIRSDCRIQEGIHGKLPPWKKILRAKAIAATWQGGELLSSLIEPVATVHFYTLLNNPNASISALVSALRLTPTAEQIDTAIQFIDPDKRHF